MYLVRVELHGATATDYESLHAAMETAGFSRTIKGTDNRIWRLPTAEYVCTSNASANQILDRAKDAAAHTGKRAGVVVAACTNVSWDGLDLISPKASTMSPYGVGW